MNMNMDFNELRVVVSDIDWDTDGEEVSLPEELQYTYSKYSLLAENIIVKDKYGYHFDESALIESASDRATNETGYCHNGCKVSYTVW